MTTYIFEAKNKEGLKVAGSLQAENMREAMEMLKKQEYVPLTVNKKRGMFDFFLSLLDRVSVGEMAVLTRQLAIMVESGFPIVQALRTAVSQTRNNKLKETLSLIVIDLESGLSLSMAASKHPEVFSRFMVNMLRSGEESGKLNRVLSEIADEIEEQKSFQNKITGVLVYPIFILCAMIAAIIVVMIYVIPQLKSLFEDVGAQLPWATRALIWTSDFMVNYWYILIIVSVLAVFFVISFLRSDYGREWKDKYVLKIPVLGRLIMLSLMMRFARTFSMLVEGGIPIIDSIEITAGVMDNIVYKKAVRETISYVEKGVPLSKPLKQNPLFPVVVGQMVGVGEQSGQLGKAMINLSNYFEQETDAMIKGVFSLFEPIMLLIVGLGVAVLVFAVLLPVFQVSQLL